MSVFTDRRYRRRGAATALVRTMIRAARERGVARVALPASRMGRGIYARLGFEPTSEMRLVLRGRRSPRARRG